MYEPQQTMNPDAREMMPNQFNVSSSLLGPSKFKVAQGPSALPHQLGAPMKHAGDSAATKGVSLPRKIEQPAAKSRWADISEFEEVNDWLYIGLAVLAVDVVVIGLVRFFPAIFGKSLNLWYNRFKLSAVIADVVIIMLGIGIARYAYTEWIYPTYDWNPLYFTGTTVVVQLIHDVLFYLGIIRQVPYGHNAMIDVFKEYSSGGAKILAGDAGMIASSNVIAMLLKAAPPHLTAFIGLLIVYTLPYILETRNNYSNLS